MSLFETESAQGKEKMKEKKKLENNKHPRPPWAFV